MSLRVGKGRSTRAAIVGVVVVALVAGAVVVATRGGSSSGGAASGAGCKAWDAVKAPKPSVSPGAGDELEASHVGVTKKLDNGLTTIVRHNERPGGGSARLALVVNAGSALEDPDQSGAAHFLEHLLFDGTEKFPGDQLTQVLEGLGVQLGADLNAQTSYDETVYQLEINAGDADKLATGLDVLAEWASKATITEDAVAHERGVVLAEERARRESVDGRERAADTELLLDHSGYAGHDPIGTVDSINTLDVAKLRRFYTDWYRPDLMAVVVVGDIDTQVVQDEINKRFADLPAPGNERARPTPALPAADAPRIATRTDVESTTASATLLLARPDVTAHTTGDIRTQTVDELALDVLDNRLSDDARQGTASFFQAEPSGGSIIRGLSVSGVRLRAEPDKLRAAVESAMETVTQTRRHPLGEEEVTRAVDDLRRQADLAHKSADTRQDMDYIDDYATSFVSGTAVPTPDAVYDATTDVLAEVTSEDLRGALVQLTTCGALRIAVQVPDTFSGSLPSNDDVAGAIAAATDPGARPSERTPDALMSAPKPATITQERNLQIQGPALELSFTNGVRVVLQPTDIAKDTVLFGASSPGGLAALADADVANGQAAATLVDGSGVGDLDAVQLDHALAGHAVDLTSIITDTTEGFHGSAAASDVEELLQLVNQRMTAPRVDPGALAELLGQQRIAASDPNRDPADARKHALDQLRFGNDPRYRSLPTTEDLAAIGADSALRVYKDRFGDASDFTFVLAGAITKDTIELAQRYLGTLPGTGRQEAQTDLRPDPPVVPASTAITAGHGPVTTLDVVYDTPGPAADPTTKAHLAILQQILEQELFTRVRKGLSATYSPRVSISDRDLPDQGTETTINLQVDPSQADAVIAAIDAAMSDLQKSVPDAELQAVIAQLKHDADYYSNQQVVEQWLHYELRPGSDPGDEARRAQALGSTTSADITALAAAIWPGGRRLELRVAPTP